MSPEEPLTVAVIGCGPGGMFFCHALETRRRKLAAAGDAAGLARLPIVTCFERATAPGGVWRAKRKFTDEKKEDALSLEEPQEIQPVLDFKASGALAESAVGMTNMYEALWTNGPKENIEFFDYTFDEHFGCELPVYMPREDLLDYMTSRVTKHCPDFFEKYVKYSTSVQNVKYNHATSKFEVTTHNWSTHKVAKGEYDKCIWAAGENGKPMMPTPLVNIFREGGFKGRVIHSSDTSNFEADVNGKRVLIIGGAYSAEDLALMAIKVGAEKLYISSRNDDNVVTWTKTWPLQKVELLKELVPVKVTDDGKGVQFSLTWWEFPDEWVTKSRIKKTISDIDTVIFCTGYKPNMDMLDDELKAPYKNPSQNKIDVPVDWKMEPNVMTEFLGDVQPDDVRWHESLVPQPDIYRGVLISNPSMMFIDNELQSSPLFSTDVSAWLFLAFITGSTPVPSEQEMRKGNLEEALRHMQNVSLRYGMDENYFTAWDEKVDESNPIVKGIWSDSEDEQERILTRMMAHTMVLAEYPVSFGTYEELNELAEKTIHYAMLSFDHRDGLVPESEDEIFLRTFRDYTDGEKFTSLFTGTKSISLRNKWIDIDPSDRASLGYSIPVARTASDESRHPKHEESVADPVEDALVVGKARD